MFHKTLDLKVRSISQNGREVIFYLKRQVDKKLSDSEIHFQFIGYVFKHTHFYEKGNPETETYKVVEILSYEFVNKDLYVSPLKNIESEVFGTYQTNNLNDGKFLHPQSYQNIKFTPKTDEGIIFEKTGYSWDKENYIIFDMGGIFNLPKKYWEIHHKPIDGIEYVDSELYLKSEIVDPYVIDEIDMYSVELDQPPRRKEFKSEEEYLKSMKEWLRFTYRMSD